MTLFTTKNLVRDGAYVYYKTDTTKKFVARFKFNRKRQTQFMKFLRNNITVERYFTEYDQGASPLSIARDRGFI